MALLEENEVLAVLHAIERGEVTIPEDDRRAAIEGWGDVEFTCSNGWRFVIYNDAGVWDYIIEVVAPDGRTLDSGDLSVSMPRLFEYRPPRDLAMSLWGLQS